ncbi:MAG: ATP-binding protein, partial [Holophagales bacterium]|nr:ATP-binding protein [Holophagales bacterium]
IDEVQRRPDLFPILRVLADRPGAPARFLILGSASPHLIQQSSESLAGRISYHELDGLNLEEAGTEHADRLWIRGGFPRSFLGRDEADSFRWRRDFVRTFLERDLPLLGSQVPAGTIGRFWTMLAHRHGDLWNASELARSFGVSDSTVRRYLDLLIGTFVVRQLRPWHANLGKRQVKSPKVYLSDSGLLHALLNLPERIDVEAHPKLGASWEGFWIENLVARLGVGRDECFFWATHAGAELDLMVVRGRKRLGFEINRTSSPRITRSMRAALESLELDRLDLVHGADETFPLAENVRAVAARRLWHDVEPL